MAGKFKFITGMGLLDLEKAKAQVLIWANAGADIFDTSPAVMPEIQKMLLKEGFSLDEFDFCVSVPVSGDIHGKKAKIDLKKCNSCGECVKFCTDKAIEPPFINKNLCIGCSICQKKCPKGAISVNDEPLRETEAFIKNIQKLDTLEIHISTRKEELIFQEVKKYLDILCNKKCKISVCLSRSYFSNSKVLEILSKLKALCEGREFLVQTDGNPMNGAKDDLAGTLEAVAFGLFCSKSGYEVILSGGTNEYTAKLVNMAGFKPSIAFGSFARKITQDKDFDTAVKTARDFVLRTKELIND